MRLRPLVRSDIPAVSDISVAVFADDLFFDWIFPRRREFPLDLPRYQLIRLRTRLVERGSHGFVVEMEPGDADWDGQSVVVGFGFFIREGKDAAASKWQSDRVIDKLERHLLGWEVWYELNVLQRAADAERTRLFRNTLHDYQKTLHSYWHLGLLGVDPKFQRRGIGAKLVRHGIDIARQENLPITLTASPMGRGLYTKLGFKVIQTAKLEGLTEPGITMLWEPEQSKGKWLQEQEDGEVKLKAV